MLQFHTSVANCYTSNVKAKGLEFVFMTQTGVWLPASTHSKLLWFRLRGGALSSMYHWNGPGRQGEARLLDSSGEGRNLCSNEHSIIDIGGSSTGFGCSESTMAQTWRVLSSCWAKKLQPDVRF